MRVTRITNLTCVFLVAALVGTNVYAGGRPDSSSRDWFGHINGGYTFATGTTSDFLDDDWTFGGGAMYWPSDWPLGIALNVNYWRMERFGAWVLTRAMVYTLRAESVGTALPGR
jgi:hypothetical protein